MSIRITTKDHLPEHAKVKVAVANVTVIDQTKGVHDEAHATQQSQTAIPVTTERENFRVTALSGTVFDFSVLAYGYAGSKRKGNCAFTGRHELTLELLPAIRDLALSEADGTVRQKLTALRFVWRTLDEIETRSPGAPRLKSATELSDVHRQAIVDRNLNGTAFSYALKCFNFTLLALGEKRLHWEGPPTKSKGNVKHLNSLAEVKRIKNALKRLWFGWRDKYDLAQRLLILPDEDAEKLPKDQRFVLESLRRFKDTQQRHGVALPTSEQVNPKGVRVMQGVFMGYDELSSYFFPDATAIRAAFHLCLATTGWNPAVLLDLKFNDEIFLTHPTDENRYIMRAIKRRAKNTEQRCSGLKKTRHGPYSIINFLIEVTQPLRDQLQAKSKAIEAKLAASADLDLDAEAVLALKQEKLGIEETAQLFFLYAMSSASSKRSGFGGIWCLTDMNFGKAHGRGSFLEKIIRSLNKRDPQEPIGKMTSTDFRDAYALHWYEFSGGDILTVMRVLGHRRVGTTITYTNNVVVRLRNQKKAREVLKAWWGEVEEHGHADSTVVSFTVRHGKPSEEQRRRLKTYRTLMLTQLGTRCSDPYCPPDHVAPHFRPDGEKVCDVQRCMLCVTHAVITPESLDGIARRLAELTHIKSSMSVASWEAATAYIEEMENTELALAGFEASTVQESIERWTRRIESGEHQVMPFESF